MTAPALPTPHSILKQYWGYDDFRPVQLDIINSVLAGNDTLGLMPTGGGKSITFQVPAMILPGLTIVVTPLISLMKDQADNLLNHNIRAGTLYLGQTRRERNLVYDRARLGKIKMLYVSPERLRAESFRAEMRQWTVSLIVIDEAHCISQWGYDFRPSYLRISTLREAFPDIPMLALTASATPLVQQDIVSSLGFKPGYNRFALSFHRTNLSYVVRHSLDKKSKLVESLLAVSGTAIVYVRSRTKTAEIAELLNDNGISATFYHAGLDPRIKEERQQLWKDNKVRVMVATNAFGMGIDKPDVRTVIHIDLPPTLEEYYQEAGRAGRDGLHSYALLIASGRDNATLTRRLETAFPPRDFILEVYERACVFMDIPVGEGYDHVYDFDLPRFCRTFKYDPDSVRGAFAILTNSGYIEYIEEPAARARVQMLIRRDDLYGIQLESDEQAVINALFRLYPGLFADYVQVMDDTIALTANLTAEATYQALLSLTRKKILHYIPKRLMPYIYMPTSREPRRYVTIPKAVYEDRRKLMEERLDAVRRFVFATDQCRDVVLLNYFGEENACDCGMCDICIEHRKAHTIQVRPDDDTDTIIGRLVRNNPGITLAEIGKAIPGTTDNLAAAIRRLIDKGNVHRHGQHLFP